MSDIGVPPGGSGRVLRGWKDIAAHLGTSVRTAQRLAVQAGLPVHRTGPVRGGVTAHSGDLDVWIRGRGEADQGPNEEIAPPHVVRPSRSQWGRRPFARAAILVVTASALGVLSLGALSLGDHKNGEVDAKMQSSATTNGIRAFRIQVRLAGRDPMEVRVAEGMRTMLFRGAQQVVFLEPRIVKGRLRIVLYERKQPEGGDAALVVAGTGDLAHAGATGATPVRFLLDDGWLDLLWLE